MTPLYAEEVHMLDGLADEEVDHYLEENPKLIPLIEIDGIEVVNPYVSEKDTNGRRITGAGPGSYS